MLLRYSDCSSVVRAAPKFNTPGVACVATVTQRISAVCQYSLYRWNVVCGCYRLFPSSHVNSIERPVYRKIIAKVLSDVMAAMTFNVGSSSA